VSDSASFLNDINWSVPWLAPFAEIGQAIANVNDWQYALNEAARTIELRNSANLPIQFVRQESLPPSMAYEAFIAKTGEVPTRQNLHDFFNALVWLHFPKTKVRLNALQSVVLEAASPELGERGKLRDAATIFDENAAFVLASDTMLIHNLQQHAWSTVFLERGKEFGHSWQVCLFGHALMEKLQTPFKAITAHAWPVIIKDQLDLTSVAHRAKLDGLIAEMLDESLTTRAFSPLPVAGLPGWWPLQDKAFYEDATVFRARRVK
jgi:hypothetical protein